ncbi:hypothetical protein G6F64_015345 [Rhizopus arrhizus]|uniref:Uncharacterized protein n=1 Tax=Rhizopus oryzae TaxID=64495 RepID=A0A9P6WRQ8_RHIOR|nr:hypothetical protein G6F64_015345 [Rhizopus arrhizus]
MRPASGAALVHPGGGRTTDRPAAHLPGQEACAHHHRARRLPGRARPGRAGQLRQADRRVLPGPGVAVGHPVRRGLPVPGQVHAPPGWPEQSTHPAGLFPCQQRIGLADAHRSA